MIVDRYDPIGTAMLGGRGVSDRRTTFYENYEAGAKSFLMGDSVMAERFARQSVWHDTLLPSLEAAGIKTVDPTDWFGSSDTQGHGESMYRYHAQQMLNEALTLEQNNPGTFDSNITNLLSLEAIDAQAVQNAIDMRKDFEDIAAAGEGQGFARFLGGLTGGALEMTQDPVQAVSMFYGNSRKLLTFAAQQAVINGGIEALRQPSVAEWYAKTGVEYTAEDFFRNVAMGAGAGTVFSIGMRGLGHAVPAAVRAGETAYAGKTVTAFTRALDAAEPDALRLLTMQQLRELPRVMEQSGVRLGSDGQAALTLAEGLQEIDQTNPGFAPEVHSKLVNQFDVAVANGRIPEVDTGRVQLVPEQAIADQRAPGRVAVENFDPREIQVDAQTFQFKSGGDELGVTARLLGIKEWNDYLAGTLTVYKYRDGSIFIVDGHQRLGLANRLMQENPDLNIQISAFVFREADGISPREAMVRAAVKNISEGSGTAVDAAKVLRVNPDELSGLPPRSEIVRQARDMMALSDEAFGAMINEVIPNNFGAVVGRLLGDKPELQMAAIGVLNKAEPANVFQAEAIVRQIREADFEIAKQENLFGDEMIVESLYADRAKVLDAAVKQLRQDKATFASLVRNAETVEVAGNVLDRTENQRRLDLDAQAIALVQTLANRKGALSDALSDAARGLRDTGNKSAATRQFVAAIRQSIENGDFRGIDAGPTGRVIDDTPPSRRDQVTSEPSLEGFDEPTGLGQAAEKQVDDLTREMFPEEPAAPAPEPVRPSPKEIEADLKSRQPVKTVDDIYELAPASQEYIAGIGRQLEQELGVEFKDPGLKKIETAREKMQRKSYVSSNQMTDISRGGFVITKASDADAIAAKFGEGAEILDEGWNFTPEGYFDRKILVRTPNGIVSEIQIWSPELIKAKNETGHGLYERQRTSTDPQVKEDLRQQMRELYAAALEREDQSFKDLLGTSKLPKVPENADLNAASSAITRPVLETSAASTATQLPPGSRIAAASLAEKDMAGRPSQSTNIIDQTPSGEQMVIPGAERISDRALAERQMGQPMRGSQGAMPEGSLFDETARAQQDLFADVNMDDEIPISAILDAEGKAEAQTMTMRDIKQMLDEEDAFIDRLGYCTL